MRAVNLLPLEASAGKKVDRALVACVTITVLIAAILAGGFFLEKANAATQKKRLAAAQAALTQAQSNQPSGNSPAPVLLTVPSVLSQEQPWRTALDAALTSRVAWDVLLRQLAYVVPDKISLTTVALGSSDSTAGAAGGTITLGGSAFSSDDLATFISTLERVPKLSQVTLVSSAGDKGTPVMTFQISAQMTVPAPPAAPTADTSTTTGASG